MRNGLIALLLFSLALVWGCDAGDQIRVAVAGPFTGSNASFGEMIKRGASLKAKEINDAGGIKTNEKNDEGEFIKKELILDFENDTGKEKEAISVATRISTNPRILAVIGHFNSSCSLRGKTIYGRKGIVALSPGSTNVTVCEGSDWMFRNLYRDDFQASFIANYIKNKLTDLTSVAVFYDNDAYGKGLADAFLAEAKVIGLNVVATESYDRDNTDFKAQLTSIKAKDPDIIFISGLYSQAGLIVKQARESGITSRFFGADGVDSPDFLESAGDAAEGTLLTTPFMFGAGGEKALNVAEVFKTEYGVEPDTWAALSYDAVGMIAEAIENTYKMDASIEDKRKAIRDHLADIDTPEEGYTGITGLTYFDKNGDTVNKPAYVKIVKDGKFDTAEVQMLE